MTWLWDKSLVPCGKGAFEYPFFYNSPMSSKNVQWIIKNEYGKVFGPYGTDAVLRMLDEKTFTGVESIQRFPDGRWMGMSSEPIFNERLLILLEGEVLRDPSVSQPTALRDQHSPSDQQPHEGNGSNSPSAGKADTSAKGKTTTNSQSQDSSVARITQKKDEQKIVPFQQQQPKKETSQKAAQQSAHGKQRSSIAAQKKSQASWEKLSIMAILIVGGFFFLWAKMKTNSDRHQKKIHLIAPSGVTQQSVGDAKAHLEKANHQIFSDTVLAYDHAQNLLVELIDAGWKDEKAKTLLCLVYKELWPFSYQSGTDMGAIIQLLQSSKTHGIQSVSSLTCEVARLVAQVKHKEALGVLDQALNLYPKEAHFWVWKAEEKAFDKNYKDAILYIDQAKKYSANWAKTYLLASMWAMEIPDANVAKKNLDTVSGIYPNNKSAQILSGVLSSKIFRHHQEGAGYIFKALESDEIIPSLIEASGYGVLAQIYFDKHEKSKAIGYAKTALRFSGSNHDARQVLQNLGIDPDEVMRSSSGQSEILQRGDQYFANQEFAAAQAEYQTAFELDPSNATAALKTAKAYWGLNQPVEGLQWAQKAVQVDRHMAAAYALAADYYSQRYDYNSALDVLQAGIKENPNNYEILRAYGLVEYRRNNMKSALTYLDRSQKLNEYDVETMLLLSKVHLALRDDQEALDWARKGMQFDSTSTEMNIQYAKVVAQSQGADAGLLYLKNMIAKYSYSIEYRLALADLYRLTERYKDSMELYEALIESHPKEKAAHMGLGDARYALGTYDKALKSYLQASIIDTSDPECLFKAGLVFLESGKYPEAIAQLSRALEKNPLYPKAHYYIGKSYLLLGKLNEALGEAQQEKKMNPNIAEPYILAAEVYLKNKEFTNCASEYQTVLKLRPQGAAIYVKAAHCYRLAENLDIAENMLSVGMTKENGFPELYKEQGAIFERRNLPEEAVTAYRMYIKLSPNTPDRAEICQKLQSMGSSCKEE